MVIQSGPPPNFRNQLTNQLTGAEQMHISLSIDNCPNFSTELNKESQEESTFSFVTIISST